MIPKTNINYISNNYYSNSYMMAHFPRYWYFLTIGSRGRGKTYSGKKYVIKKFVKQMQTHKPNTTLRKFMWWRLTDGAVEKILENNGETFFERDLLDKYKIVVRVSNNDIFFALRSSKNDDGEYDWMHVGKVGSIQSYYKNKGNQYTDYDDIIMDELVRAESEKRTFNIPKAFINSIENVCRKRKGIRVMIYANAIGEMQEVKELFGFMPFPGAFGVYKLHHKRAIIEYLDDSEDWKKEQAQTMAGVLQSSSEFTNVHRSTTEDVEDYFIERRFATGKKHFASILIQRGIYIIVFSWNKYYYIDTSNYINDKDKLKNCYALDRTLVNSRFIYSAEFIKLIKQLWENASFRYASPIVYEWFRKALEEHNLI
jgi:hypothetical protein